MELWRQAMALTFGGVLGVNARYWLSVWILRWASPPFPWPTFLINVSGSLVIGVASAWLARHGSPTGPRLFLVVGVLGGYTTFSSYMLESVRLIEEGRTVLAALYLAGSVGLGLLAVVAGLALGKILA